MATCCEEQEERAAELRKMRRDATELQESRLLFRGLERDSILRGTALCEPCEPCEPAAPEGEDGEQSDGEDGFLALRAKRLNALREKASKDAARRAQGYGVYSVLSEDPTFAQLRGRHLSIVHLVKANDELSAAIDSYLSRVAADYSHFKLYRTEGRESLLDFAGLGGPKPALLAFKAGAVVTALEVTAEDCDDLTEAVVSWLRTLREDFTVSTASDDEEAAASSFCGKAGCGRTFPHEHVEWRKEAVEGSSDAESDSDLGSNT